MLCPGKSQPDSCRVLSSELQLTQPSPLHPWGCHFFRFPSEFVGAPGELGLQMSGDYRASKAKVPGEEGDVTLLDVKREHGNNRVGNVLKLISEISFLWVSLNFWQKYSQLILFQAYFPIPFNPCSWHAKSTETA